MTSNPMIPSMTFCAVLPLGACGDTKMDRGLSGAGIGAAAGAVGGALLGNPARRRLGRRRGRRAYGQRADRSWQTGVEIAGTEYIEKTIGPGVRKFG